MSARPKYLRAKLDPQNEPAATLQGLSDRRTVQYLLDQLSLQFGPSAATPPGGSDSGKGNAGASTTTPAITITNTNSATDTDADCAKSASTASSTPDKKDSGSDSGSGKDGSKSSGSSTPPSSGPPAVSNPSNIVATAAKLTSIEMLQDQLAYRNAVNAALKDKMLDDTHDLHGLTLYSLKFDLAVVPGVKEDRPLVVGSGNRRSLLLAGERWSAFFGHHGRRWRARQPSAAPRRWRCFAAEDKR